jgi:hypothetical protein
VIIMETLTDKQDWHKKIFDGEIVSKWKKEALSYPDTILWQQATGGKVATRFGEEDDEDDEDMESEEHDEDEELYPTSAPRRLKGIMSNEAFDYVGLFSR